MLILLTLYLLAVTIPDPPPILVVNEPTPVMSEITAGIEMIFGKPGDAVHIGDPLIQLDKRKLVLRKNALQTRIHEIELHHAKPSLLSPLYTELEQTEIDLERTTITSPVNGMILSVARLNRVVMADAGECLAVIGSSPNGSSNELRDRRRSRGN